MQCDIVTMTKYKYIRIPSIFDYFNHSSNMHDKSLCHYKFYNFLRSGLLTCNLFKKEILDFEILGDF